ncbi:MAG: hypothetical protein HC788_09520 [Sphingopyxis sp.]|nr:hypothetical protein [Sphingopyxis sp.]
MAAVLVWQTIRYNGLVGWLAEWQFKTFDRFFPVATVVLLTALLALPFAVILFVRLRKAYRGGEEGLQSQLIERAALASVFFNFGIIASAVIAVALFFIGLAQGSIAEKPVSVNLSQLVERGTRGPLLEGKVKLKGTVLLDRIGYYREGFVFTSRELWVAPVVTDARSNDFTTFVQIKRAKATDPRTTEIIGYLKSEGVPGGLAQLYTNSGYAVAGKPNLIYSDLRSVRWPYWSAASDFAVLLLLLSVGAIFHNRYRKKLAGQIG